MSILITLLIIALGGAAVFLLRLSKTGEAWARPAAAVCSVLVIVLAVVRIVSSGSAPTVSEIMDLNERYKTICGEVIGDSLAERHPGARVVVLTQPTEVQASRTMEESLQSTLESKGLSVTLQPLEISERDLAAIDLPGDLGMTREMKVTMLMETPGWFDAGDLRKTLSELKSSSDLVVCLFDYFLPLEEAGLPRKGSGPGLVVVNANVSNPQPLLDNTVLDSIVQYRKGFNAWEPGAKLPKKIQDAFDQRYELMTSDNS